jgi:hypothetical protein
MSTPDRSATVRAFYAAHPGFFTADRHDENRRRSLPDIIAHLESVHPTDRGRWGVLVKHDRNDKVPCDVIVWKDTLQSVDIMDATGGIWGPHDGTIRDGGDWHWAPADVVDAVNGEERALRPPPYATPGPINGDDDEETSTVDLAPLVAKIDTLTADVAALRDKIQQLLDRPAPAVTVPDIQFPRYEGSVSLGPLGNQAIVLHPKSD